MNQYVTGTNFIVVQKSNIPQNDVKTLEKKFGLVIQAEDIYIWNALCTHCLSKEILQAKTFRFNFRRCFK